MARNVTPLAVRHGWIGPDAAKRANDLLRGEFPHFFIASQTRPTQAKRTVLWDASLKVLGKHLPALNQQIGDCVSMGTTNAVDYLACADIAIRNQSEAFRHTFPPYVYGVSRVLIGGEHWGEGSCGVWAAQGVTKYGVLWADYAAVPAYSGAIAKQWGSSGPPDNFVQYAKAYPVKTTAKVTSYTEVRDAIGNYYPVTVASNRGFMMTLQVDKGKAWGVPLGIWGHQMCFIGVDDDPARPGCYCMNSWGPDAFRYSIGEAPPDNAPPGGFWVDAEVVDRMARQDDSFVYSDLVGFPERSLDYLLI